MGATSNAADIQAAARPGVVAAAFLHGLRMNRSSVITIGISNTLRSWMNR